MSIITEHVKFDQNDLIKISDFESLIGHAEATTKQPFKGEVVYLQDKGDNKMSMEIKADRVRIYKITEINMLSQVDLPSEYLARPPHCYKTTIGNGFVLRFIDHKTQTQNTKLISIGEGLTEAEFILVTNMIRIAGKRLYNINHKNYAEKKERKEKEVTEWTGSFTFKA